MTIHTQESMSGFIAADPQLSATEAGEARLYLRVGQEHYRKEPDGSFTELEPTFHDLVAFRKTAVQAAARFAKGDKFVAEGYVHAFAYERDGQQVEGEEFVAKKIGHDAARTRYEVTRRREATAERGGPSFTPTSASARSPRRESQVPAVGLGR